MIENALQVGDMATVLQTGETAVEAAPAINNRGAAALAVGLAALGSGIAERSIGAAAVGALAEDSISFGVGLVMTVLPETLVILTIVTIFLMG